jgi:phospholipid transport system transporter-binding protein
MSLTGSAAGTFTLSPGTGGEWRAAGALTFATASNARLLGLAAVRAASGAVLIDCGGVKRADSAGLAVVLDWFAAAKLAGRQLRLGAPPQDLLALARISELERLLTQGL